MRNYRAGIIAKEVIVNACTYLFYTKGYSNTTYKDISEYTEILPSVINYHMKSKDDIAKIVFESISGEILCLTKKYISKTKQTESLTYALYVYFCYYLIFNDRNYRNLLTDTMDKNIFSEDEIVEQLLYHFREVYTLDIEKDWSLNSMVCRQADDAMYKVVINNFEYLSNKYSFEEIADYNLNLYAKFFPTNQSEYNNLIVSIKKILPLVDWNEVGSLVKNKALGCNRRPE